jgi:hypothetical protein
MEPVPAVAFQPLPILANETSSALSIAGLDRAHVSAGAVSALSSFVEPGAAPESGPTRRARVDQPEPGSHSSRKPAKYTLHGEATFYDAGFTAMRLPRGTVIIVCGRGGCLERVVTDYGPLKPSRVIDLYRPDFFKICGCPSWSGVVDVTVYVY